MEKLNLTVTFANGQTLKTFLNAPITEQKLKSTLAGLADEMLWMMETQPHVLFAQGKTEHAVGIAVAA